MAGFMLPCARFRRHNCWIEWEAVTVFGTLIQYAAAAARLKHCDMTFPPLDLRFGDCRELDVFLAERLYEFNSRTTGYFDGESFGATQRDESGTVVAGISGFTWGGCCFVSYLWVSELHRGKGLGRALLEAFEKNAVERRCKIAFLSSHSFQSPGFYKRMGYAELARIEDYPAGHADFFFGKRLASVGMEVR